MAVVPDVQLSRRKSLCPKALRRSGCAGCAVVIAEDMAYKGDASGPLLARCRAIACEAMRAWCASVAGGGGCLGLDGQGGLRRFSWFVRRKTRAGGSRMRRHRCNVTSPKSPQRHIIMQSVGRG